MLEKMIGDVGGTAVAMTLIVADVVLHVMNKPAEVFDAAIPIIVALYLGGRSVVASQRAQSSGNGRNSSEKP